MKDSRAVKEEPYIPWYSEEYIGPRRRNKKVKDYLSLTPQDIMAELQRSVVNQEEACRRVSVMMYQHLQGHRFVGMLAGPTGSGKSFIAESLREMFPDVVYIRDVSNVTCDGWKGEKKVGTLFYGVTSPYAYNGKIYPMIFLDECDKLFTPRFSGNGENVSESVQSEFLTAIHGGEFMIPDKEGGGSGAGKNTKIIDTSNISFLFAGAFERKATAIAEKESGASIGFGASHEKISSYNRDLTIDDIREAGCMTELCGRINKIVCLNKFGEDEFRKMLDAKDRGPVYEMEKEFNISIHISNPKKEKIAHDAYRSGLGIRGIKNVIRDCIDELTWEDCNAKVLEIE